MKKIISTILCLCMIVAVGCLMAGCGNDELLQRLDDLQAELQTQSEKIEELQTELQTQNGKIDALQVEMQEQKEINDNLKTENEHLRNEIAQIAYLTKTPAGKFVRIEEAYESETITKDDVAHIIYFMTGEVEEIVDGNLTKVDFEPKIPLSELSKEVEFDIKLSFCIQFYNEFFSKTQNVFEAINKLEIEEYLGEYNGNYVVRLQGPWQYGLGIYGMNVGGIVWQQGGNEIFIFSYFGTNDFIK